MNGFMKLLGIAILACGCSAGDIEAEQEGELGEVQQPMASCQQQFQICWSACEDGQTMAPNQDLYSFCHSLDFSGLCDEGTIAHRTECKAMAIEACMKGGESMETLLSAVTQNCLDGCATRQTACLAMQPLCRLDSDCGTGNMCIKNACYKKCTSNLTCRSGEVCTYYLRGKVCMAN